MTLKRGEKFICDECGEEWDGPIQDYTVPGRTGAMNAVEEQCCECDKEYTVVE